MRITNNLVLRQALRDLTASRRRLSDLQIQVSSGKRILKPEDDPFGLERSLGIHSALRLNQSHLRTIEATRDWMTVSQAALQTISDSLEQAGVLALSASNDSLGEDERRLIAEEVEGLLQQAVSAANTRHHDRFVFAGYQTDTQPFDLAAENGDLVSQTTVANTVGGFANVEAMSGKTQLATDSYYVEIQNEDGTLSAPTTVGTTVTAFAASSVASEQTQLGADTYHVETQENPALSGNFEFRVVDDTGTAVSIYDAATDDGSTFSSDWQDVGDTLTNYATGVVDTERGLTISLGAVEATYVVCSKGGGNDAKVTYAPGNMQFRLVDSDGNAASIYDAATDDGTTFTSDWQNATDVLSNYVDGVVDTGRGLAIDFGTVVPTNSSFLAGTKDAGAASVAYVSGFDVVYNGDGGEIQREIEPGHNLVVNLPGNLEAFSQSFAAVRDLLTNLRMSGITGETFQASVAAIGQAEDVLLAQTTAIGSRASAVDQIKDRLDDYDISLQDQLAKVEDLDMAEGFMRMTNQEVAYQALLQVAARLSQPILLDYLR